MMRIRNFAMLPAELETGSHAVTEKKTYVDRALAHDDGLGVGKMAPVDIHAKIPGREAGERANHASRKLIVWGSRADCFSHRERDELPYA